MNWRSVIVASVVTALGFAVLTGAFAQQQKGKGGGGGGGAANPAATFDQKPLKEAIVGSWRLLISDAVKADGTQMPQFGPNPMGLVIFSSEGRYSLQVMRDNRGKFAANDRLKGTPDEIKAAFNGMITHFGRYTVNDQDKSLTFRIEGSSYPNWNETKQMRVLTALVGDDLTWSVAMPSAGGDKLNVAWRRIK